MTVEPRLRCSSIPDKAVGSINSDPDPALLCTYRIRWTGRSCSVQYPGVLSNLASAGQLPLEIPGVSGGIDDELHEPSSGSTRRAHTPGIAHSLLTLPAVFRDLPANDHDLIHRGPGDPATPLPLGKRGRSIDGRSVTNFFAQVTLYPGQIVFEDPRRSLSGSKRLHRVAQKLAHGFCKLMIIRALRRIQV